jgi:methylenetetrahydrofolate reductase (NADPH)
MSTDLPPRLSNEELKRRIVEFVRPASTEISTNDEDSLPALSSALPPGTTVYVAHIPKATLQQVVRVALKVQAVGLRASPHIVARRLQSEQELRTALRLLHAGGVEQVMLVAGDLAEPLGCFDSTLNVLDSGCFEQEGIQCVGVCGHPEGNRAITPVALWEALSRKQTYARRTGLKMHIVTQFTFDPEALCAWDRALVQREILLPVHVGIAGPTPLPKLIKFAVQCGVGVSLRSMMKNIGSMSKMARSVSGPEEMLIGVVRGHSGNLKTRLRQPHFYAFGGAIATAQWLRKVIEGRFELPSDNDKFHLQA